MNLRSGIIKNVFKAMGSAAFLLDIVLMPLTLISIVWFRLVRYWGVKRMPLTKSLFLKLGMFPIVNHYYEPLFDYRKLPKKSKTSSFLDFRVKEQLDLLKDLKLFSNELKELPIEKGNREGYYYSNGSFESGDSEFYYSIIRKIKPKRILEVGSGFSTLMALEALNRNALEDKSYNFKMTCIEPYEMPFLEKLNVSLIREIVEEVDPTVFAALQNGDILFIDSSHIIRPGGDVTYLVLNVLPSLSSGVWIHIHDIFTPYDYPVEWLRDEFRMWNEQYLLESFLINNSAFEIMSSLSYLNSVHGEEVREAFPVLASQRNRKPCSFWIRKK